MRYLRESVEEARAETCASYDLAELVFLAFDEPCEGAFGLVLFEGAYGCAHYVVEGHFVAELDAGARALDVGGGVVVVQWVGLF